MQRLEVSGAVRPIYGSLGVKRLSWITQGDVLRHNRPLPHFNAVIHNKPYFDVLLTVHLSIILATDQLHEQILVL